MKNDTFAQTLLGALMQIDKSNTNTHANMQFLNKWEAQITYNSYSEKFFSNNFWWHV